MDDDNPKTDDFWDYLKSQETKTFLELAKELDTIPINVIRRFRHVAEETGQADYFLRSSLLRQLYRYVPNGIRSHGEWNLIRAISSWVGLVGNTEELLAYCKKVGDAVQGDDQVAEDWLPESADDPKFVKYFEVDGR